MVRGGRVERECVGGVVSSVGVGRVESECGGGVVRGGRVKRGLKVQRRSVLNDKLSGLVVSL